MSVFRNTPIGAVSRAFGITTVRRSDDEKSDGGRSAYQGNSRTPADPPPRRTAPPSPPAPPPTSGTAIGAAPGADYPLAGLLFCAACQLPLRPVEMLGGRAYGAPCGCRLTVVAADTLERLVFDAVVAREPAAGDCGGGGGAPRPGRADSGASADVRRCWAVLFRRYLAEVRLGGAPDDLTLIWVV